MIYPSDGWLSPEGVPHDVGCAGHSDFANNRSTDQEALYGQHWVKISGGEWYGDEWRAEQMLVTQRQFDYIYEWHEARGRIFNPDKFQIR